MRERNLPWEAGDEEESLDCRIKPVTVYLGRKGHPNPCAVETVVLGGRKKPQVSARVTDEGTAPEPRRSISVPKPVSKGHRITKATAKLLGGRGGKRRSARKTAAARRNARRPRPSRRASQAGT